MTAVVRELVGGDFVVRSRTTDGAWWLVTGDACSCPATVKNCWHRRQVDVLLLERNRKHVRPTAPPNVSALVD